MSNYTIRKATLEDISFLSDAIIAAEKSNTDKLSLSTLFNLSELEVQELIKSMLDEEIDGCEFSVNSFLVVELDRTLVAAVGGWIENLVDKNPSKILKSNLIGFTFPKSSIEYLQANAEVIKEIQIEREIFTLQIEYVFVDENHRGNKLAEKLIKQHIQNALSTFPELKKVQVHVFSNNQAAIKLYERIGFHVAKTYTSNHPRILNFLPFNEKLLMEINI